ncbi:MAG: regulatory protein GemA [Burkholderiaceae bacterium]|nr:regulatory protein GemA [Burkholderiaceae bacterium]
MDALMAAYRKRLLALAHMAAAQAGCIRDDDRRAVQQAVTGVASCADMDVEALERLIRHWQRAGAAVRLPARPQAPGRINSGERAPLLRKLAAQCADGGYPWPEYPLAILRRMGCEVARIEWAPAPELRRAVAALAYQAQRRARRAAEAGALSK